MNKLAKIKNSICITVPVIVVIIFGLLFIKQNRAVHLPADAKFIEERQNVQLYKSNDFVYITSGKKLLGVLDAKSGFTQYHAPFAFSLVQVTNENVSVREYDPTTEKGWEYLATINRENGALAITSNYGSYLFTAPDESYVAIANTDGSKNDPGQGTYIELLHQGSSEKYLLNGLYNVRAAELSPDENKIAVFTTDTQKDTQNKTKSHGVVFIIELSTDPLKRTAKTISTFDKAVTDEVWDPFDGAKITWNSDAQITILEMSNDSHTVKIQ